MTSEIDTASTIKMESRMRQGTTQEKVIDYPLDASLVTIEGQAGGGKTHTLLLRARRIAETLSGDQQVILSAPSASVLTTLRCSPQAQHEHIQITALHDIALEIIAARTCGEDPDAVPPRLINDVQAAGIFERACDGLLSLEWEAFAAGEIDPEVAALRTPERFISAAYRLVRKLHAARITPEEFTALCTRGAAHFYEHPPHLPDSALLNATSAQYRDSLRVDQAELQRQRRHEHDLAIIINRLRQSYSELLASENDRTAADALNEAAELLHAGATLKDAYHTRYPHACIDEGQDITSCELSFLQALYGHDLHGVTIAGDARQATRTFAGARGEQIFTQAKHRFTLQEQHRCPTAIVNVARRACDPGAATHPADHAVTFHRAATVRSEASYVAQTITKLLTRGTHPSDIAIIARGLSGIDPYLAALLERDIPTDIAGDAQLHDFACVRDATALLWSLADPYRHDHLLRALQAPILALCDASLALLCAEPSDPQTTLLDPPKPDPSKPHQPETESNGEPPRGRRDCSRELRLCRNVFQGDRDQDLPEQTRERLIRFRAARARWEELERTHDLPDLARAVMAETLLATPPHGARTHFEHGLITRLLEDIDAFAESEPLGSLHDALLHTERSAQTDPEFLTLAQRRHDCVSVLSVEAAKGRAFAHVFLIDARAAGFVRYYAPDAFLFYPSLGIIAKENVGEDARAARTAKFTYAMHRYKTRERYVEEERRAFAHAAARASEHLHISASGRPTRGNAAPELLEELRRGRLPGVRESDLGLP